MATEYVTGALILAQVAGAGAPSTAEADEEWAAKCAAAVNAAIDQRLEGTTVEVGSNAEAELIRAAVQDGAAAYIERKAPHGVLSLGPDGEAVRLGAEVLRVCLPVIGRYHPTAGIGIG